MVFVFFVPYFNQPANLFSLILFPFFSPPASGKEGPFSCCGGGFRLSPQLLLAPLGASLPQSLALGPSACDLGSLLHSIERLLRLSHLKPQILFQHNSFLPIQPPSPFSFLSQSSFRREKYLLSVSISLLQLLHIPQCLASVPTIPVKPLQGH